MPLDADYLEKLRERSRESRIYKQYQSVGLALAEILGDKAHTALYMKLAKTHDADKLMLLAKRVAARKNVKNKGAYFMKVYFSKETEEAK